MKKKVIGSLLALTALVAVAAPAQKADAQVIVSNRCCNGYNQIVCIVGNGSFPLGDPCTCDCCPGVGHIC